MSSNFFMWKHFKILVPKGRVWNHWGPVSTTRYATRHFIHFPIFFNFSGGQRGDTWQTNFSKKISKYSCSASSTQQQTMSINFFSILYLLIAKSYDFILKVQIRAFKILHINFESLLNNQQNHVKRSIPSWTNFEIWVFKI